MSDHLKVVPLPPPTDGTAELIAVLEATLERAKAGDLEAFAMVGIMRNGGSVRARHAPEPGPRYSLIGALSYEQHCLHGLSDQEAERTLFLPEGA